MAVQTRVPTCRPLSATRATEAVATAATRTAPHPILVIVGAATTAANGRERPEDRITSVTSNNPGAAAAAAATANCHCNATARRHGEARVVDHAAGAATTSRPATAAATASNDKNASVSSKLGGEGATGGERLDLVPVWRRRGQRRGRWRQWRR